MTHPPDDPPFERPPPSPATLLPPKPANYRTPLVDRFGDDRTVVTKALGYTAVLVPFFAIVVGAAGTLGLHLDGWKLVLFVLVGTAGLTLAVFKGILAFAGAPAAGLLRFVAPDGSTTPYQRTFSHIEALAVRGLVAEAAEAYETELRATPDDLELITRTADLYLTHKQNPARAAELLRHLRRAPNAPQARQLYASQRLVDLYLGPLNDRGKAIVELRMVVDRFAGSPAAAFAREGLARLKREHHAEP